MKNWLSVSTLASAAWFAATSVSFAGSVVLQPPTSTVGAPAPLLGAGLSGLAVLAVTGAGYLAVRFRRRDRD
jgi:hypothetical protein